MEHPPAPIIALMIMYLFVLFHIPSGILLDPIIRIEEFLYLERVIMVKGIDKLVHAVEFPLPVGIHIVFCIVVTGFGALTPRRPIVC